MKWWKTLVLLIGIVTPFRVANAAELGWPAFGLMDPREGTLEFWIRFAFDPREFKDVKEWKPQGELFRFTYGDPLYPHDIWTIAVGAGWAGPANTRSVINNQGEEYGGYFSFGPDVRRGEWYHFAWVWSEGRRLTVYVNGRPVAELPPSRQSFHRPVLPTARLRVKSCQVAVDEVRLSCVARKPEDLGCGSKGTAKDAATVWLLTFDQADPQARQIAADYSASTDAGAAQVLPEGFGFISGKTGQALALCGADSFK